MRYGIEQKFRKPKFLDKRQYEQAFERTFDTVERNMQENFDSTMRTWRKKGKVVIRRSTYQGWGAITGTVESRLWHWLNEGTPERIIYPNKAKVLVFRSGFKAKTTPNRLLATRGKRFGKIVFAKFVRHRIRARNFGAEIDKESFAVFQRELAKNINLVHRGK